MSNPFLHILAPLLAQALAPIKTVLENGVTNPTAVISAVTDLAGKEISNLPELEHEAISDGCKLALDALSTLENSLLGASPSPAPSPAAAA